VPATLPLVRYRDGEHALRSRLVRRLVETHRSMPPRRVGSRAKAQLQ
jgi:hypothetical protein